MHSMVPDGEIFTNKPINFNYDLSTSCANPSVSVSDYNKLKKERDELLKKCDEYKQQLEASGTLLAMKTERINYLEAIINTVEVLTGGKILKE